MLDRSAYPHIFDAIVAAADDEGLTLLRCVSKDVRDRADSILKSRRLVWTSKGIFAVALRNGPCAVRKSLPPGEDPLGPYSPKRLLRPVPRSAGHWKLIQETIHDLSLPQFSRVVDPSKTPSKVVPVLDIWPGAVPYRLSGKASIMNARLNVLRVWPDDRNNFTDSWGGTREPGELGDVGGHFDTIVFHPAPDKFHRLLNLTRPASTPQYRRRVVLHLGILQHMPGVEFRYLVDLANGGEVILVAPPILTALDRVNFFDVSSIIGLLIEIMIRTPCRPSITIVNADITIPPIITTKSTRVYQTDSLGQLIRTDPRHSGPTDFVRFRSFEEYAAEVGQAQFDIEMEHRAGT